MCNSYYTNDRSHEMNEFHQRLHTKLVKGKWERRCRSTLRYINTVNDSCFIGETATLGLIVTAIYISNEITDFCINIGNRFIYWRDNHEQLEDTNSLEVILDTSRDVEVNNDLDGYKRIVPIVP